MSGTYNPIVFYPAAVLMLVFACLAIWYKNIFYSLLSAIVVFFFAGMFFYVLGSEYNAVIQIAIYGVAVPIILGLAVMFTDMKPKEEADKKPVVMKYATLLTGGVFILAFVYLILTSFLTSPFRFNKIDQINNSAVQVINIFGQEIFIQYVLAFELVSLILTIIVVGLTMYNKKEEECKK